MRTMTETGPSALEVQVCFDGAVLGVHHLRDGQSLTLGPAEEAPGKQPDYAVAGLHSPLQVASCATVSCVRFLIDSTGEVELADGTRRSLTGLVEAGLCQQDRGAWRYELPAGASARLRLGALELVARAVTLPSRSVPRPAPFDWRAMRYTAGSLLGGAVLVGLAFLAPPDPRALGSTDLLRLDSELLRTRFVPAVVEVKPPTLSQLSGGGESRPVAGPAGHVGHRYSHRMAPPSTRRPMGPEQRSGTDLMALVRTQGVLGSLGQLQKNSAVRDLFDGQTGALGQDAQAVMSGLVGQDVDGFGDHGGSLVQVGPGSGGGCAGPECGSIAVSMDRVCTGPNCGRGPGGPGKDPGLKRMVHKTEGPVLDLGRGDVIGGIDKDTVRRVIRSHMPEFKFCYEQQLLRAPELSGRVVMSFAIGRDGRVVVAGPKESTLNSAPVLSCLSKAVERMAFPQPQGGGLVQVSYPFVFHPAGAQ